MFFPCRSEAISVTGYDPSLPQDDVKSALRKHFASCGEITDILVLDRLHNLVLLKPSLSLLLFV